ncbi:MAG: ATP phosphoribosyltransferase [Candidatus Dadabacteria bacterium]|nr:MAG: ATP phosphoribosyltransferase [Candidatus Dadabacteria bacterium]
MTLRIAIAKGRILRDTARLFDAAGIDTGALLADGRSLIRPLGPDLEALIVRSQDVPLVVSRGAAAIGITGYDTLREKGFDLFELLDLRIATCRMSLAGPRDLNLSADPNRLWRVASKYPRVTREAFERAGRYYEIVPLSGTLETAPETGLADCIVDLVDTGGTLRAHDLIEYEVLFEVSSRLVASRTGFFRFDGPIRDLVERLQPVIERSAA